jgi:hypothetical protein
MAVPYVDLYKELGENFRHTLRWREILFAGFLALIGALAVAVFRLSSPDHSPLKDLDWVVTLSGSVLAVVFWLLDRRCHEVLIDNYKLGELLEKPERGYYADARRRGLQPKRITHTWILGFVYQGAAFVLFLVSVVIVGRKIMIPERDQISLFIGLYSLLKLLASFSFAYLGYKLILTMKETGVREMQTRWFYAGLVSFIIGVGFLFWSFTQGAAPELKSQVGDEKVKRIVKKLVTGEKPNAEETAIVNSWAGITTP